MIIKVEDLLKLNSLSNCRLVGGSHGLSKEVRWFWICYLDEIDQWVKGKEIAFVTGIISWSEDSITKLMQNFHKHNISAIFLLLETHFSSAPEHMIALADKYDIPLFEMPNVTPLVDITRNLARLLLQSKTIEDQTGDILKNCIFGHDIDLPRHENDLIRLGCRLQNANYIFLFELANYVSDGDTERITEYYHSIFNSCSLDGPFFFYKERYIVLCVGSVIELSPSKMQEKCRNFFQIMCDDQNRYAAKNIGISDAFTDMKQIKTAYHHAVQALETAVVKKESGIIQSYAQMNSIVKVMMEVENTQVIQNCYKQTIGKLIEYDQKHNTDFLYTLEVFFAENGNVVKSAKALKIHRNTMIYRMERINFILSCSIEDMNTRFDLMTDLMLYRYRGCHPQLRDDSSAH